MGKTLQQELEKLETKEAKAQLWAHVEQMRRQKAKDFSLPNSGSIGKLPDSTGKKLETARKLSFRDKLELKRAKTIKDLDLPYNSESRKALNIFTK